MGTLYLVRHGQASFGSDDYDRLSDLGRRQCERLGQHFRARGLRLDAVLTGTLRRQRESWAAIAQGLQVQAAAQEWPGLNEYDGQALVDALGTQPPDDADPYRHHFRLLRDGLARWMAGQTQPRGMPSHAEFVAGIEAALDHVRTRYAGDVLIVSSGGPIATAVGQVLGATPAATIELNMRIRNSAVTEFAQSAKRHVLLTFNTLPHLEALDPATWVTYA